MAISELGFTQKSLENMLFCKGIVQLRLTSVTKSNFNLRFTYYALIFINAVKQKTYSIPTGLTNKLLFLSSSSLHLNRGYKSKTNVLKYNNRYVFLAGVV